MPVSAKYNLIKLFLCFLCLVSQVKLFYIPQDNTNKQINNFAFGSCFGGFLSEREDMFKTINKVNPDMFVWSGDVTYLDNHYTSFINHFISTDHFDNDFAEKSFNKTFNNEYYSFLRKNKPVMGVWDDHDFGINNSNKNFKHKEIVKSLFLDFMEEPENSARRSQSKGIQTSYTFGKGHKSFKIILLDVRYYKEVSTNPYSDMLGEEQWDWLEKELDSEETFTFLVTGTQFLNIKRFVTENWYLKSRERLFDLIGKKNKSGVIFLSGDVHFAEFLRTPCIHPKLGYHIYEITSSGLSHHSVFAQPIVDYLANGENNIATVVTDFNFGLTEFNWGETKEDSSVKFTIYDINQIGRLQMTVLYTEVSYNDHHKDNTQCEVDLIARFKTPLQYFNYYKENPQQLFNLFLLYLTLYLVLKGIYLVLSLILKSLIFLVTLPFRSSKNKKDKEE